MKKHAIILHLYYTDLWEEFRILLEPILQRGDVDLYVSLSEEDFTIKSEIEKFTPFVYILPNKGLDVGPFLFISNEIQNKNYTAIFKIHTKKSLRNGPEYGEIWRKSLISGLIGTPKNFEETVKIIEKNPFSMIGSKSFFHNFGLDYFNISMHLEFIREAISDLSIKIEEKEINNSIRFAKTGSFFAGTMFATSHQYIKKLFENADVIKFYEGLPNGYVTNSKSHAIERIFGFYLEEIGGKFYLLDESLN